MNSRSSIRQLLKSLALVLLACAAVLPILLYFGFVGVGDPRSPIGYMQVEIHQLSNAFEEWKDRYGSYPPNLMENSRQSEGTDSIAAADVKRAYKKAFPRSHEPENLILALAGVSQEGATNTILAEGMTAEEALVFWLRGVSTDPQYPLSGKGGPSFSDSEGNQDGVLNSRDENFEANRRLYEFDLKRLGPRTPTKVFDDRGFAVGGGRYIEYDDPRTGERRRINFWQYYPMNSQAAIAYFATAHAPAEYYPAAHTQQSHNAGPLLRLRDGFEGMQPTLNDLEYVNQNKFQILHPGLDDQWGDFTAIRSGAILFPDGPFGGELADTLTNFVGGRLDHSMR